MSYGAISKRLGVSKGTLSYWLKDLDWSSQIRDQNHQANRTPEKILRMQEARRSKFVGAPDAARQAARDDFQKFKGDPLFAAGLMLYLSQGDRSTGNSHVRLSGADPYPIMVFKRFLDTYCAEYGSKLRFSVLLYPNLNEKRCLEWWSALTGLGLEKALKSQVIQGRSASKKLLYGVATLTISSKFLKAKLLQWIELASKEFSMRP